MKSKSYEINIKGLIALAMADVEIFLTMEPDQTTPKEKLYTRQEIISQLKSTMSKICTKLPLIGYDIDEPLKYDFRKDTHLFR